MFFFLVIFLLTVVACYMATSLCYALPDRFQMINCPTHVKLYSKAFIKAMFCSQGHFSDQSEYEKKVTVTGTNWRINTKSLEEYVKICGYENNKSDLLPMCYLETCFIRLILCLVCSPKFYLSPLGLIHVRQRFTQNRNLLELLDKSTFTCVCSVDTYRKSLKGIEVDICLKVYNDRDLCVLEGITTLLSRSADVRKKKGESLNTNADQRKAEEDLPITLDEFTVKHSADLGVKYAQVSGDWNPHHLWTWSSRLLGYKAPIAHGMWTMARCLSYLDQKELFDKGSKLHVDVQFKRPIFLPSSSVFTFQQEKENSKVHFKVRDEKTGVPQLLGTLSQVSA